MTDNARVPDLITSPANRTIKRYRALARRKHRRQEQAFTVEGLQPVWRAATSSWEIDTLLVAPELLTNAAAIEMVADQRSRGVTVAEMTADVFARISDRDGPAGLAAIVRGTVGGLDTWDPRGARPLVALHEVANPGNIGTVIRSADAAGAGGVVLVGETADPLAPGSVKASMGSLFAVPMAHSGDVNELFGWASAAGRDVVAISGHTEQTLWHADVPADAMLLFGSEGDGLPDDTAARCAATVAIPMEGTAESLNLATATSVTLFECKRRRDVRNQV